MIYKKAKTKRISFPLGGIGTGSIGLAGNGGLIDWEIFNRPNKNTFNGYSHFALKVSCGGKSETRVLQGDTAEDLCGAHDGGKHIGFGYGPHCNSMAGFPHFRDVTFDGAFPVARLKFSQPGLPVTATLRAFNPFIPHEEDLSSLPAAFFEWELCNKTNTEAACAIAFSVANPAQVSRNEIVKTDDARGIWLTNAEKTADEIGYTDLCVLTDHPDAVPQAYWYRGKWQDGCTTFWKNFSEADRLPPRTYDVPGTGDHGTVAAYARIPAGGAARVRFVLAWNTPNQYNYWKPYRDENGNDIIWKNYYATRFADSRETAAFALRRFSSLYRKTNRFARTLWQSTLPRPLLDAISANLSVLKSPTVLRLADGSLWGWEGCSETVGSCEGSCQHVWNYAYALPFLFPRLERSLRENTLRYALTETGATKFRVPLPAGRDLGDFRPCVDGQMGEVIKCYREWKISGDTAWLCHRAEDIFKMLEFAWSPANKDGWDADRDGVIEGRQHHTLDMELFGPNSWLEGFYLLALDCASKIADAVGDAARAADYRALYTRGKRWTNEHLFNGSYFCQQIDLGDKSVVDRFDAPEYWNEEAEEIKYQVASGCVIDQMLADWHAVLLGAYGVFDAAKKRVALQNLYRNNYKPSMRAVTNMWRNFALDDESGTVICTYPAGTRTPAIPVPYCEECMAGFEYAAAGLMIANGFMDEGVRMAASVRARYDGEKRNPWNEFECGSNYARSMASFALLPIWCGFTYDMPAGYLGFSPVNGQSGRYLWSVGDTWGRVEISAHGQKLTVLGRPLVLHAYGPQTGKTVASVRADGREIAFSAAGDRVSFARTTVQKTLEIAYR